MIALLTAQMPEGRRHLQTAPTNVQGQQGSPALGWTLPAAALDKAACGRIERAVMIDALSRQMPFVDRSHCLSAAVG